jgi:uncharacterized membrane protein
MGGGMPGEVSSDDRLWGLLIYLLTPLVPVIVMLMEDKKNRPFLRSHNAQALVLGVLAVINAVALGPLFFIGCCTGLVLFGYQVYLGVQAYGGKTVTIPVITDFVRNQGWA